MKAIKVFPGPRQSQPCPAISFLRILRKSARVRSGLSTTRRPQLAGQKKNRKIVEYLLLNAETETETERIVIPVYEWDLLISPRVIEAVLHSPLVVERTRFQKVTWTALNYPVSCTQWTRVSREEDCIEVEAREFIFLRIFFWQRLRHDARCLFLSWGRHQTNCATAAAAGRARPPISRSSDRLPILPISFHSLRIMSSCQLHISSPIPLPGFFALRPLSFLNDSRIFFVIHHTNLFQIVFCIARCVFSFYFAIVSCASNGD